MPPRRAQQPLSHLSYPLWSDSLLSSSQVPIVKEVAKSEDELLAELLVAEVTATDPDPDDILADVMAGLDEEVVQEEPKQEVSPKMTKKDDSKEILEEQEEDAVETNEVSTVGAAVELEGEGGGGDMVGGYGEQASAEEIKALAAKQAEERAERKAKLEEKKKKKEEGLRRTKTMPTTGTPKKMEERLKSVAAQPLAVKRPALVSRFKLMNLLPAFWVVVSASLLGWLVTLDGLSDVFSVDTLTSNHHTQHYHHHSTHLYALRTLFLIYMPTLE